MQSIPDSSIEFIRLLSGSKDPRIPCVFCAISDKDRSAPVITLRGALDEHWAELSELNARNYGIFIAVNQVDALPRVDANVTATRCLVADFDSKNDQQPPPIWPLPPSMLVRSGGGWHAYWLGNVPLKAWNTMQGRVAAHVRSDPHVKGLPRVMRLPGLLHCRGDAPVRVRLEQATGACYSAAELDAAFPDERMAAAAHALAKGWKPGTGHAACMALAGALARAHWTVDVAHTFITSVCAIAGTCGPPTSEVSDTFERFASGQRVTGWASLETVIGKSAVLAGRAALGELGLRKDRPVVWVGADEGRVARELLAALVTHGETYTRGGSLVYVARNDDGALRIHRYSRASLRSRLTDAVTCVAPSAQNDDAPKPIAPPDPIVAALCETPTLWDAVPALEGIADYPVMAPSGRILGGTGYDPETRLWVDAEIPDTVPLADAVEVLREPYCDFPITEQGISACIALVLTIIMRPAIRGACPAFLFDSNSPRTGKKKAADATVSIATGRAPAVTVQPFDDDEFRKRVLAILESGSPVALIDDCKRSFGGGVIDPLLTAWPYYSDRRLGVSEIVSVPATTVWCATGTNMEVRDHTANRVILIRLETELEDPARRDGFRYPRLESFVLENVEIFRGAALALVQSWLDAGRPECPLPPLGSFESWGIVRDVLHNAGLVDPVAKLQARSLEIDGAQLLYQEIERVAAAQGTDVAGGYKGLRVPQIIRASQPTGFAALGGATPEAGAMDEALSLLISGERTPRRVGAALRVLKGRVVGGRALDCARGRDNTSVWYLRPAKA